MSKQQQQQPTCVYDAIREMHKGISELQNALQALTELVGATVWDNAPAWARWAAMDESEMWYYYSHEPLTSKGTWYIAEPGGVEEDAFNVPPAADWRTSLTRRPESCK